MRFTIAPLSAIAGAMLLAGMSAGKVDAAPLSQPLVLGKAVSGAPVEQVQWRRGWHGRPYYGRPYYHNRYRGYRGGWAPFVGGLATGAIIGGALTPRVYSAPRYESYATGDAVAYCSQRFKSYDPASGTYLGYDGKRHACP